MKIFKLNFKYPVSISSSFISFVSSSALFYYEFMTKEERHAVDGDDHPLLTKKNK